MIAASILAVAAMTAAQAPPAEAIEGRWTNPSGSVIIDIAPCGDSHCGTVVWATEQAKEDASKGTPQLIGTQLLTDLKPKDDIWEGRLFVPDQRLHAEAKIQPEGAGQLKVSGCEIGICKSQVWSRAQEPVAGAQ